MVAARALEGAVPAAAASLGCVLSASMFQSDRTELSCLRHLVRLVLTPQSDQPELSLACVEAPIQLANIVIVIFFFDYGLSET